MPAEVPHPVCSVSVQSGSTWDLSSLANSKEDYTWTSASGDKIVLNVCRSVVTELFGIDKDADTIGAFIQGEKGDRSIGSTASNLTLTNASPPTPILILPNGASCAGSSDLLASTLIHFTCSSEETGPVLLGTLPPTEDVSKACGYVFEWKTKAACPRASSHLGVLGDWGAVGVLVGLSIVLLLSYLLGSFLYNRFILKLRGTDQLPRFSLPSCPTPSIPNPFSRSGGPSRPFGSWRRSSGYGRIPAEPLPNGDSDEEDGLVGRFGLDSDDEDEDARALEGDSRVWRSQGGGGGSNGNGTAPKGNGLISL